MVRSPLSSCWPAGAAGRCRPFRPGCALMIRLTIGGTASSPFGPLPHVMAGVTHPSGVMLPVRSSDVVLVYPARPAAARSAVNQGGLCGWRKLVLGTLADVIAASVDDNSLARREFTLARMAGLIDMDALPAACLANAETSILPEER
jgi:hypothetical protein